MNTIPLIVLLALAGDDPSTPVATASLASEPLVVGQPLAITVRIDGAPASWWGDPAKMSIARPILLVDAPECVKLLGAPVAERVTPLDYETNYLRYPAGRKLFAGETSIEFELLREPEADERIGLNLVYWLDNGSDEKARFVRRRLELEVAAGAVAVAANPMNTSWGTHETLGVGDEAQGFALPAHDGYEVDLEGYRGAPVLIVTYRAHW
jgi:hypothetical protein